MRFALASLVVLCALSPGLRAIADSPHSGRVRVLTIDGVINSVTAEYVTRELHTAERNDAAVVIQIDTPGGLESSMRLITGRVLNARIPVIAYVAPQGARAASAGMFIVLAANVAAMAPATNLGAAHPVGMNGRLDPTMSVKVTNDVAAFARSIAVARGRNAEWAERAVRENASLGAQDALSQGLVDLVAEDLPALLREVDGRRVTVTSGELTLRTRDAPIDLRPMTATQHVVHALANPDIAFLLFAMGLLGILAELSSPGISVPGVLGTIAFVLAFVAFGALPTNAAGVIILLVAGGLFAAEFFVQLSGALAAVGLAVFVLGALMLFAPGAPDLPSSVRVSRPLVAVITAALAAFVAVAARATWRTRRQKIVTGIDSLLGRVGKAVSDIAPRGFVRLDGETWSAVAEGPPIHEGESVSVSSVEGVTLRVERPRKPEAVGRTPYRKEAVP